MEIARMASGLRRVRLPNRYLVRARLVVPVVSPPIAAGAVLIHNSRIAAVGPWDDLASLSYDSSIDLGSVVLLPAFINAHCHLDYTDMAGQIPPVKRFSDWIKAILAVKAHQGYSEYAVAWLKGARMLLSRGVTTVVDIEAVPELLPDVLTATPLRVCSLLEMTAVRSRRPAAEILEQTIGQIQALPGWWTGLSPHAPYSTTPELLRGCAASAREHSWLMAMHVAESAEEFQMYVSGSGSMFEWLRTQRDMSDCGAVSPVACLHRQGMLGSNLLAIHANYLAKGDAELLGATGTNVVHCPRSHDYFKHEPFPYEALARAGVNLCLGTDSLATIRGRGKDSLELDLFSEMRQFSRRHPTVAPELIVDMVTRNSARAIGKAGQLGELSPGAHADLITLPFSGRRDAFEGIIHHAAPLSAVMMDGDWIVPPNE
jgi:cytosine/adenosine deaminase-related metal-dependent hydrolase